MEDRIGSPTNNAKIFCPITQGEEFLRLCAYRRNRKWCGKGSGSDLCDCAMDAGKCTAAKMMAAETSAKRTMFFSATEKVIAPPKPITDNISAVIATSDLVSRYPLLTMEERERLMTATVERAPAASRKPSRKVKAKDTTELLNDAISEAE